MSETARRLADLLLDLQETLDLEIKAWLDLSTPDHQSKLAKGIIALANHGGGYIAIGFDERHGSSAEPAPNRPSSLKDYTRDRVNGIAEKYLDPVVHCEVHHVRAPDGKAYPLIVVPGGHRIPIMAKRDGPTGGELRQRAIYIRRAGPKSEEPRSAQEMNELFTRCFGNRRDEIGDLVRTILSGNALSLVSPEPQRLTSWISESRSRWEALTASLPSKDERRMPLGHTIFAYQLLGTFRSITQAELLDILREMPRHTGWPPMWAPTRQDIQPYPMDGAIECWLGRDGQPRDAAHSDFWRISTDGLAFLIRGYQEDGPEVAAQGFSNGTVLDVTIPVWRCGEVLLHAQALASALGDRDADVKFHVEYTGLSARHLASVSRPRLLFDDRHTSHQAGKTLDTTVRGSMIRDQLPEILYPFLRPLYEIFSFFQLSEILVQEEITKMKSGKF